MPVIDTSKDLVALFLQQARATPDAPALEDASGTWTYAELDRATARLAERLRRRYAVARDRLVGVLLGRSADYVVACLAALRAGGAFLVLELAYPPRLLADVVRDARPAVVVTHAAHAARIQAEDVPVLLLDRQESASESGEPEERSGSAHDETEAPLPPDDDLDRLAFVSYSSGTTGRPKGIANPHRAPVRSYALRFALSDLGPGDRVACNVFFVWEMLRPLLRGATVLAVPDDASYDPAALVDLLAARRATETLMTPTLLATVLARHDHHEESPLAARLPHLRTLWLNGEVVPVDLARRALAALPHVRLLNCYSASETHEIACGDIAAMLRRIVDEEGGSPTVCPVGPPLDPAHTYILDEAGRPVPPGASGELCVGGGLLARGYLNLPETTAQAFLPDPFAAPTTPGARMYRTGDLARLLPSGLLEITGRVGHMIKIRGYSVVPAAVEAAVVRHLAVRHCAVVARGDGLERQLVAYVVPDHRHNDDDREDGRAPLRIDESGLSPLARRVLLDHLAHYMIPSLWIAVDALPTHEVSGKVDLQRLPPPPAPQAQAKAQPKPPSPVNGNGVGKKVAVRDRDEETIARAWAAALKLPPDAVSDEHDFFDLGGHSLALADLARRLAAEFGCPVPVGRLALDPTLRGHLDAVREARDGHTALIQADLPAVLRADAVLPDDIRPPRPGLPLCPLHEADTVLLTGVTGFLGAFLLSAILEAAPAARVVCLVRFDDPTDESRPAGISRIRKHFLDLGLWHDSLLDRVEVLPGNLARPRLGLSAAAFDALARRVQVIVHAAATVNLVYPYAALRAANVGGTREILRLASRGGATLHHISTNGVLPPSPSPSPSDTEAGGGWPEDATTPVDDVPRRLPDGYGQTKWVAEQLVLEAARRGLPVRIHRPGTISGHSTSGATNAWDLLTAVVVESLHLGAAPDIDGWRVEMTPVDFVSDAIVALASHVRPLDKTRLPIYHLGDPAPVPARRFFDDLAALGYPTERLPWDRWVALWNERRGAGTGGDEFFTADILRGGMPADESFLQAAIVLDDAATRPLLEACGLRRPPTDRALLETYTRHFYVRGWLPKPPRRDVPAASSPAPGKGSSSSSLSRRRRLPPLAGRVAVITGASSGIGAAVAVALAREGAHVALGARREDALDAVRVRCQRAAAAAHGSSSSSSSSRVIVRATDVTDRSQVEALVAAAEAQLGGPVDVLVACAGVMYYTLMANARADEWERTVDVNCKGLLHALAATVPGMVRRGRGHVVAISSDAGRKVFPGLGVYSASKFFVEAALQALRLETAGAGLRVTAVQPGNTATDLLGMSTDREAVDKYGAPTGAKILQPEEVAEAIVFAVKQPEHVAVNEILIEPREEPI